MKWPFYQGCSVGNGHRGDDVTSNIKTIRSIPLKLKGDYPKEFEIRGEGVMPFSSFEALNREREDIGEPLFANPRNSASGTLKMQNSSIVASRKLDAYFYYVLGNNLPDDGHYELLQHASRWGFKISEHIKKCKSIDEVFEYLKAWNLKRKDLPVATDGVVIKINSQRIQSLDLLPNLHAGLLLINSRLKGSVRSLNRYLTKLEEQVQLLQ